jgi:transposase
MNLSDKRQAIIELVKAKKVKQSVAAETLGISVRQIKRLCRTARQMGVADLQSARRGQPAFNRIPESVKQKIIQLAQNTYSDFGPTFMAEKLSERDGIKIGKETLRKMLSAAGIWKSKSAKKISVHQSRERRTCFGEMVQIDGSPHAWFEERGASCCLILFVDDATSKVLYAQLEPVETTAAYFRGIIACTKTYGIPFSYYSDKHMIFRVSNAKTLDVNLTQFERACEELGIETICAHSPQAKGRVERMNRTFQDRLVKEFRLAGINNQEAGNAFLETYLQKHNQQFAVCAYNPHDAHLKEIPDDEKLTHILSIQEKRTLTKNLELSFQNTIYQIVNEGKGHRLQKKAVSVCQLLNGEVRLLSPDGYSLQYRVMASQTKVRAVADQKSLNAHIDQLRERRKTIKPSASHPWRRYEVTSSQSNLNPSIDSSTMPF